MAKQRIRLSTMETNRINSEHNCLEDGKGRLAWRQQFREMYSPRGGRAGQHRPPNSMPHPPLVSRTGHEGGLWNVYIAHQPNLPLSRTVSAYVIYRSKYRIQNTYPKTQLSTVHDMTTVQSFKWVSEVTLYVATTAHRHTHTHSKPNKTQNSPLSMMKNALCTVYQNNNHETTTKPNITKRTRTSVD